MTKKDYILIAKVLKNWHENTRFEISQEDWYLLVCDFAKALMQNNPKFSVNKWSDYINY